MMSPDRYRQSRCQQQQGVALLAALILMLAVVLVLGSIFFRHQMDVSRTMGMYHGDQARLLALSTENWARQLLSDARDDREVDSLQESWALAVPAMPVDGGFISGCIIDLQGRINLNSFASYDSGRWDQEMSEGSHGLVKTWLALLTGLELPATEAQAASIIDWVDSNNEGLNQWGAEQSQYEFERSPRMVPNAPLTDVEELAVIRGFDVAMMQAVVPWVSALPTATSININTASEALLLALGGEYGENFAARVQDNRPYSSLENFREDMSGALGLEAGQVGSIWPESLVGVSSDYFLLTVRVSLGSALIEVSSVLDRHERREPVVLQRSLRHVPLVDPALLTEEEMLSLESECMTRDARS